MALKEKLLSDLKTSMKNKDKVRKDTITMIRAAILQIEKDEKKELTDDEIIEVAFKQLKQRRDALDDFKKANRDDLIEQTEEEIKVIEEYLPEQLTEDELESIITEVINDVGATSPKQMGQVMKAVMPKVSGRADGKTVSKIVTKILNN